MFSQPTPAPGSEGGGLANAIIGSLMMIAFTVLISTPVGILAGVYLAEYGDESKTAEFTRFITDIMLSAPSIVLGLFVYAIWVSQVKHFSGWAGSMALSLIAIPVVVRTTENMLRLVPGSLREAAFAWGTSLEGGDHGHPEGGPFRRDHWPVVGFGSHQRRDCPIVIHCIEQSVYVL